MKYMMLIYHNEQASQQMSPEAAQAFMGEYFALNASLQEAGIDYVGEALHPVATATTVSVRDGNTVTTDGPFAETKEQLGGFYMLDADNLDDAIAIAARIPDARTGRVEVRPVVDFSQM